MLPSSNHRSALPSGVSPEPYSWVAQGARFTPCALGAPKSPRICSWDADQAGRGNGDTSDHWEPYSRCYCLPTHSVHFARLFLPASSRSVPYHPQERLLVACWCLLIPFPFTPATGPALGPRRKIEIQLLTRCSPSYPFQR